MSNKTSKSWIESVFKKKYPNAPQEWIDKAVALEVEFEEADDFVDEVSALKTHNKRIKSILTTGN